MAETPMMRQYQEIKSQVPDAVLLFRLGDFYEMFGDDAVLASKELEITLTGRGQGENRSPMCGVPYHSVQPYVAKLISRGYKVAICEQVEDPAQAKGVVKRDVVKIITPGTVMDETMLSSKKNNYLMAISRGKEGYGIAFCDASTGEFRSTDLAGGDIRQVVDEIERIMPSEILAAPDLIEQDEALRSYSQSKDMVLTTYGMKDIEDTDLASKKLNMHFRTATLKGYGLNGNEPSVCAASAVMEYLSMTQKTSMSHISGLSRYDISDFMIIDTSTRRNLELVQTMKERTFQGSLLWIIDRTRTPMGSRCLRNWLLFPLKDIGQIRSRLDAVEELTKDSEKRQDIFEALDRIRDVERLTGKISAKTANARDLIALKESLLMLPALVSALKNSSSRVLKELSEMPSTAEAAEIIGRAIAEEPPVTIKDGGLIKTGFDAELDGIKSSTLTGKEWISSLEEKERQRTGIKALKVGYTKVFGYYIEVSNSNVKYVPMDYIRKQTLVNAERFITPELKDKESMVLNAEERITEREYELFCAVRDQIAEHAEGLKDVSARVAQVDALLSLADVAVSERYAKPVLREAGANSPLLIKGGRHPVSERTIGKHMFVPNDTCMKDGTDFFMITGPNMAGKSTYMRQVALIVLMAHMGSFVPADSAEVPVTDRIFTRVGALDDLYAGQSTFMVEMLETANILHNATSDSLVILDEIGRGTATFDGMSIAKAVAEYIGTKIHARTLFATHYHEITSMSDDIKNIKNLNVSVKESGDNIVFMHKIVEGTADKSYGIHVAKLAGLPKTVVDRAKTIYDTLEMVEKNLQ